MLFASPCILSDVVSKQAFLYIDWSSSFILLFFTISLSWYFTCHIDQHFNTIQQTLSFNQNILYFEIYFTYWHIKIHSYQLILFFYLFYFSYVSFAFLIAFFWNNYVWVVFSLLIWKMSNTFPIFNGYLRRRKFRLKILP